MSGVVVDENEIPVVGSTVVLYKSGSSTAFKGSMVNDEGHFSIITIPPGKYKVIIQMMGFETIEKHIDLQSDMNLGVIHQVMSISSLDEVTITANLIERFGDRFIYHISR
ncbi:MAG: carboxypeptidase-like regulatory domain-containing protein [Bacteroidales bacterium]